MKAQNGLLFRCCILFKYINRRKKVIFRWPKLHILSDARRRFKKCVKFLYVKGTVLTDPYTSLSLNAFFHSFLSPFLVHSMCRCRKYNLNWWQCVLKTFKRDWPNVDRKQKVEKKICKQNSLLKKWIIYSEPWCSFASKWSMFVQTKEKKTTQRPSIHAIHLRFPLIMYFSCSRLTFFACFPFGIN